MNASDATVSDPAGEPWVRIVRGTPTAEELAALVGVLSSGSRPIAPVGPGPSRWRASALPNAGPRPGPGAWRASALPG